MNEKQDDTTVSSSSTALDMERVRKQREEIRQSLERLQRLSEESRKTTQRIEESFGPLLEAIEEIQKQHQEGAGLLAETVRKALVKDTKSLAEALDKFRVSRNLGLSNLGKNLPRTGGGLLDVEDEEGKEGEEGEVAEASKARTNE